MSWNSFSIYLPLIVFISLLIITAIIGFFSGGKRMIYWGVGSWLLIVIGYVLYLTCGSPIANLIARYLKVTSIDNNDLKNIIKGGVGVLLCLVSLMVGSLVILLPCYFLIYKRLFHLHQKKSPVKTKTQTPISKIQGKKIWLNRFVGLGISVVCFFPTSVILTSTTTALTTSNYALNTSKQKNIATFDRNILSINSFFAYWDNPLNLSDSIFGMINLSQNKAFEDFFNLVEDSFNIDSKDFGANPDEYRNLIQNYINDTLLTEYDNVWNKEIIGNVQNRKSFQSATINDRTSQALVNSFTQKAKTHIGVISESKIDNFIGFVTALLSNQRTTYSVSFDNLPSGIDSISITFDGIAIDKLQITNNAYNNLINAINEDVFLDHKGEEHTNPGKDFINLLFLNNLTSDKIL